MGRHCHCARLTTPGLGYLRVPPNQGLGLLLPPGPVQTQAQSGAVPWTVLLPRHFSAESTVRSPFQSVGEAEEESQGLTTRGRPEPGHQVCVSTVRVWVRRHPGELQTGSLKHRVQQVGGCG